MKIFARQSDYAFYGKVGVQIQIPTDMEGMVNVVKSIVIPSFPISKVGTETTPAHQIDFIWDR